MFTVTHGGLSKDFSSLYDAMRYAIKHWQYNAIIWSDLPLWSTSQWIAKKQESQAKAAW